MRSIVFVLLCTVLGFTGVFWSIEARVDTASDIADLIYDSNSKVYHHQDQGQFANHSLEQKMLAIQYVTRHEDQLATRNLP